MILRSLGELKSYATSLRTNFERGSLIFFPDTSFFAVGGLPFSRSALDRIEKIKIGYPWNIPSYIMLKDIRYLPRFVFMSAWEWFAFNLLSTHNIIFLAKMNFALAKKSLVFPGGKIGVRQVRSGSVVSELLDIIGGVCFCIPLLISGRPVFLPDESQLSQISSAELDIFIMVPPEEGKRVLPTVIEMRQDTFVSVIFEGDLTKQALSDLLIRFGLKVS